MLHLMEKWFCAFVRYTTQSIYLNELILTLFNPFDIKCKKLDSMWKTSGNVFLGHLREWVFHIFARLHSIMGVPLNFSLEFLWIILQYSVQALCMQHLRYISLWQKIGNGWKLLVDCCYIELPLHLWNALINLGKFSNKVFPPAFTCSTSAKNICQIYSQLTI